jgi:tetratricopeptide (TPR) repeat protein
LLKALTLSVAEFGETSEDSAQARNNLAVLYKYWGRFDDGVRLYEQALASMIAIHGEESLACASVYHNLGGILHARGDFVAAEEPGRKAWEISRRLLGENDPRTMLDAVAYAAILDGLERYDVSEPIYRSALSIFDKAFGAEHDEMATTLHNLAAVLAARGDMVGAEQHYRRALAIKETLFGADHPDVAMTSSNLGRLLTDGGRSREAVPLLARAVTVLEQRLPRGHPHLELVRNNLRSARVERRRAERTGVHARPPVNGRS